MEANNNLSNIPIIVCILKWKKHIGIAVGISIVISVIISSPFIIKPKYKSIAVLYPINVNSFSNESPTEQLIQIFDAVDIRNNIIKKFNLAEHYNIDTNSKYYHSRLVNKLESNVTINKTDYQSIEIIIYDTDPVLAKEMVQAFIDFANLKINTMLRKRVYEYLVIDMQQLDKKKKQMDSLENILQDLRVNFNLVDYGIQAKEATKVILKGLMQGKKINPKIDTLLKNIEYKGGILDATNSHLWKVRTTYNDIKLDYENALRDYNKNISYTSIVSSPFVADKKSYPVRWLIVFCSALATFVLALTIVSFYERYPNFLNEIKKELIK